MKAKFKCVKPAKRIYIDSFYINELIFVVSYVYFIRDLESLDARRVSCSPTAGLPLEIDSAYGEILNYYQDSRVKNLVFDNSLGSICASYRVEKVIIDQ